MKIVKKIRSNIFDTIVHKQLMTLVSNYVANWVMVNDNGDDDDYDHLIQLAITCHGNTYA